MVTPEIRRTPAERVPRPEGGRRLGCGCQTAMSTDNNVSKDTDAWTQTDRLGEQQIDDGERLLLFDDTHPSDAVDTGRWLAGPRAEVEA